MEQMTGNKINALVALHSEGRFLVGRERIKLLEKVAELGSIAKAAKVTGFSYKTAWDSVNAVNNLLPTPAFLTRPGGRSGGGAEVTPEGLRLIATFHRLEAKLSLISNFIAEEGLQGQEEALLWAVGARISARNVFQAEVTRVERGPVDVEVVLKFADDLHILSIITNEAADDLGLAPGRMALALVKSPFIQLYGPERAEQGGDNCFLGEVTERIDAERNSEIRLDIAHGKSLHAVVARACADELDLRPGVKAVACFDPSQVILAVN
jgi:molybdate transport system regulatory protein